MLHGTVCSFVFDSFTLILEQYIDTRLWLDSDCRSIIIPGSWRLNKTDSFVYQLSRWKCNGRSGDIRYSKAMWTMHTSYYFLNFIRCRWKFWSRASNPLSLMDYQIVCFIPNSYLQSGISRLHGITVACFWWEGETALPSKCQHHDTSYVVLIRPLIDQLKLISI